MQPVMFFATQIIRRKFSASKATPLILNSISDAISVVKSESTVLLGGFGICGIPENLIEGLVRSGVTNLTVVTNNSGQPDWGVGKLVRRRQVSKLIAAYIGDNAEVEQQYLNGELEVEITPQGNLAEKLRAASAGIPAFFTRTGVGTLIEKGGIPQKFKADGKTVETFSSSKEIRNFNGIEYMLESAMFADFALIKAWKADTHGNLVFRKSARNFNPVMCRAAKISIVEAEEIVEAGCIDPQDVHLPGIYVDRLVRGDHYEKRIAKLVTQIPTGTSESESDPTSPRFRIARRASQEFKSGMYVNLGVGIPNLCLNFLPKNINFKLQSENGVLGLGPYPTQDQIDADMINAGKETATVLPGASFFASDDSFAMIRGGHINVTILGALQVSQYGDLANWMIPGRSMKGMGGAMDLVSAPDSNVIVTMEHTVKGQAKILRECSLPLTGKGVVRKIITEKCVFDVNSGNGLVLIEISRGTTLDEVRHSTTCDFKMSQDLKHDAY